MRRSGRVSLVSIVLFIAVAMVAVVVIFNRPGPGAAGAAFMDALARSDVDKLTKLTYLGKDSEDEIRKKWEFATQVSARNYVFEWNITAESPSADDKDASVRLSIVRNAGGPGAYPENFSLPMVKVGDAWKVDVGGINHEMYPGIPRSSS